MRHVAHHLVFHPQYSFSQSFPKTRDGKTACVLHVYQVDVMFLYTEAALVQMGGIAHAQVTPTIYGGLAFTNAAFAISRVDFTFNITYLGL